MKYLFVFALFVAVVFCDSKAGIMYAYYSDQFCSERPFTMYAHLDPEAGYAIFQGYDQCQQTPYPFSARQVFVQDMSQLADPTVLTEFFGTDKYVGNVQWFDEECTEPEVVLAYAEGCHFHPGQGYFYVESAGMWSDCNDDCSYCDDYESNNCYSGGAFFSSGDKIKGMCAGRCDASGVPCGYEGHCQGNDETTWNCVPDDLSCDDDDPCTEDTCTNTGCQHEFVEGNSCTPSNPCFSKGVCTKSWDSDEDDFVYSCEGTKAVTCSSDDCHVAFCDALAGGCVSVKTGECPTNPSSEDSTLSSGYITSGASVTSVTALLFFLGFVAAF